MDRNEIARLRMRTPGEWYYNEKAKSIVADQPEWSSDQSDICYLNEEAGDADGFADTDCVAANGDLIAAAPRLLDACSVLLSQRDDLFTALSQYALQHNSRPAAGSQDGLMIHKQRLTDFTLTMIALCRKYSISLDGV